MNSKSPTLDRDKAKKRIKKFRPIDDEFFEQMYNNKEACQELLRAIFSNDNLNVKRVDLQKDMTSPVARGVRLDALCTMDNNTLINVEVQKADDDDHIKRAMYNAACIITDSAAKGIKFEQIPETYVVFITKFPVYDGMPLKDSIEARFKKSHILIKGFTHYTFVNASAANDSTKLGRLMLNFLKTDFDDPEFPEASKRIKWLKHTKGGEEVMSNVAQEISDLGKLEMLYTTVKDHTMTISDAVNYAKSYGVTDEKDFRSKAADAGYDLSDIPTA